MDLQNRKELKSTARQQLDSCPNAVKIACFYAAVTAGAALLTNGVQFFLNSRISQTGGLQNMGLRSVLSTLQTMLPLVFNFLLMCLGLGFTGTMLRVSRRQYISLNSLKIGFSRFWVLLRATLLQGGFYILACMAGYIISIQIFFLTPMSRGLLSAMAPVMTGSGDVMEILNNPAVLEQLASSMIPLYLMMGIITLVICAPIYYRFILVKYLIIDRPGTGALMAIRDSRLLMRGSCMKFFKLDLSLWPYYLASLLALLVSCGVGIFGLLGISLPGSPTTVSVLFFLSSLVISFLTTLFLKPHMEVTHALAYETLRPKVQHSGGVVLGNIFDLAKEQNNME